MRDVFLRAGDRKQRSRLLHRFKAIDENVPIATMSGDALRLAHALLVLDIPGDVVECGCYAGGSTAKLSIVAALTHRELHVYDSFEGLPATAAAEVDEHAANDMRCKWRARQYAAGMTEVMANIRRYGEIDVCTFHKGWFDETLPAMLPARFSFVFVDADLPSSVRICFAAIWPRLAHGGLYFTHDAAFLSAIYAMYDAELWREIGEIPPPLIGAGYGIGGATPHLGLMVKGITDNGYVAKVLLRK